MTDDVKKQIDGMNYEEMLRLWRFSPSGTTMFQGDTGTYFTEEMKKKRKAIGELAAVTASKNIGWAGGILLLVLLFVGCTAPTERDLTIDLLTGKLISKATNTETSIGSLVYHEVTDPNGISTIHIKIESYKVAADRMAMERDQAMMQNMLKAAGVVGAVVAGGIVP